MARSRSSTSVDCGLWLLLVSVDLLSLGLLDRWGISLDVEGCDVPGCSSWLTVADALADVRSSDPQADKGVEDLSSARTLAKLLFEL